MPKKVRKKKPAAAKTVEPRRAKKVKSKKVKSSKGSGEKVRTKGKIVGFGYQSPAVVFVLAQNTGPNVRLLMVNDQTPKEDIRATLKSRSGKEVFLCIVAGARNLYKLGSKPKPYVRCSLHDTPEVLHALRGSVRLVDAVKQRDGSWAVIDPAPSIAAIKDSVVKSVYVPTSPKKVRSVLASAVAVVPSYDRKFDPIEALDALFGAVREEHRENVQFGVYRFMAGISTRRSFSGVKRSTVSRLTAKTDVESFKRLWSNLQGWIEDNDLGRNVSAAYQLLCSRKGGVDSAPVAAARTRANLAVLNRIIRVIPPSRRQTFDGWIYNPGRGE